MAKYNGYAVKISKGNKSTLALYRQFTRSNRGHDDEVDRVRVFKSRKNARAAKAYLERKFKGHPVTISAVKVWAPDPIEVPETATKALLS